MKPKILMMGILDPKQRLNLQKRKNRHNPHSGNSYPDETGTRRKKLRTNSKRSEFLLTKQVGTRVAYIIKYIVSAFKKARKQCKNLRIWQET